MLAVQAKVVLAMLTSARVFVFFHHSNTSACRNRAPTHIIHLRDCVLNAKVFVFLQHSAAEADFLDIQVVQRSATARICALNVTNFSRVDLCNNHVHEAFSAEVVLTARQKSKFVAKQTAHTDRAQVLFGIKSSLECPLTGFERGLKLSCALVLQTNATICVLSQVIWILSN